MERNAGYGFHREAEHHTRIYLVCGQKTSQSQLQRGVRVMKNPGVGRSLTETLVVSCCSQSCTSQGFLKMVSSCGYSRACNGRCDIPAAPLGMGIQCLWSRVVSQAHCEESSLEAPWFLCRIPDNHVPWWLQGTGTFHRTRQSEIQGAAVGFPSPTVLGHVQSVPVWWVKDRIPLLSPTIHRNHHPNHFAALNRTATENKS